MGNLMIQGVQLTPLRRIAAAGGEVLHAMKLSDLGFAGFGEAYFSSVDTGATKGWRRHRRMTMNLIVPVGAVRVAVCDDREKEEIFQIVDLSPDGAATYQRLTVPPGLWTAFRGNGHGLNLVLNIASIEHDPAESELRTFDDLPWRW
jgi:dTDP-4-dehydrorhamnose 3,5-epimerase